MLREERKYIVKNNRYNGLLMLLHQPSVLSIWRYFRIIKINNNIFCYSDQETTARMRSCIMEKSV